MDWVQLYFKIKVSIGLFLMAVAILIFLISFIYAIVKVFILEPIKEKRRLAHLKNKNKGSEEYK